MSDLLGRRSQYAPIRTWLKSWDGGKPTTYPLIIHGESGCGKSLIAELTSVEADFDPIISEAGDRDSAALKTSFGQGRSRSFFGQSRIVIVDDAMILDRREWREFESLLELKSFPLIILATTTDDVPYQVRRNALIVEIERPSSEHLFIHLQRVRAEHDYNHTDSDLRAIAEVASSWRSATLILMTIPPNMKPSERKRNPTRLGHSQVRAILMGQYPVGDVSVHPLQLLAAAEFNQTNPDVMIEANSLHSRQWATDLLGPIARHYLSTLRANSADRPPFRNRKITGSSLGRQV